jgi:hypothetical protein
MMWSKANWENELNGREALHPAAIDFSADTIDKCLQRLCEFCEEQGYCNMMIVPLAFICGQLHFAVNHYTNKTPMKIPGIF